MERFFGAPKTECLHHYRFKTRDHARRVVFEYIEVFYNRIGRYATIQNHAPLDYAHPFHNNEQQIAA
jgi:putative transposase